MPKTEAVIELFKSFAEQILIVIPLSESAVSVITVQSEDYALHPHLETLRYRIPNKRHLRG